MSKIAIVTDSTCSLPNEFVEKYKITVAPQVLIWGEETFEDGVNIQPEEFYTRLKTTKIMPSTSQATIGTFHKIFTALIEKDYQILAILVSSLISGTVASAVQAKDMLPEATIEIVDSLSISMAMGFHVLSAARAIEQGANLAECKALAEKAREHSGVVFAVDTLEFLHRGGRIGGGTRFLGTALNIKPILEFKDGRIEAVERVRTRGKRLERLLELSENRIAGRSPIRIAALHADSPEDANWLLQEARKRFNPSEAVFTEVSPVVGTHAGPGTVGLAFMAGM